MNSKKITHSVFAAVFIFSFNVFAQINSSYSIFGNLDLLEKANIPTLLSDKKISVGFAKINDKQMHQLHELSHDQRSCSGFEVLSEKDVEIKSAKAQLEDLARMVDKEERRKSLSYLYTLQLQQKPEIIQAVSKVQSQNIQNFVTWLSSFNSRYARLKDPNQHVNQMYEKLKLMLMESSLKTELNLIDHKNNSQKTIQLKVLGRTHPSEVIVLGAHFDSISGWMGDGKAPGADDNASGSGSLFEALRVLLSESQPDRTIEFYWYAGEELGLLGSSEIAKQAKAENKKVVGVLNFDMTMFPGDGENNITLMTDFTSTWMNDLAKAINQTYLHVQITEDKCGYGCSDHASWFRNGFPALMATEAGFHSIFSGIHTDRDVVSSQMSFSHAAIFAKLALALAMELGESTAQYHP